MFGYGEKWQLAHPYALLLLLAVPLVLYVAFVLERRRSSTLLFSRLSPILAVGRGWAARLWFVPKVFRVLGLIALTLALARPQVPGAAQEAEVEGIDIVLTLDISTSMKAHDLDSAQHRFKDRLQVAKEVIDRFIAERLKKRDRIGLVVFNRDAYTQCPLTLDYGIIRVILRSINIHDVERRVAAGMLRDGTAIGDAIGVPVNRLRDSDAESKVIVLLTDGENNSGQSPIQAAAWAKANAIRVFPILVGKGEVTPSGRVRVRSDDLVAIAKHTEGQFFEATDRKSLENNLHEVLNAMKKTRREDIARFRMADAFLPFLLAGAIALAIEMLLRLWRFRKVP
jgi:Ca-activated chloride channel family protein